MKKSLWDQRNYYEEFVFIILIILVGGNEESPNRTIWLNSEHISMTRGGEYVKKTNENAWMSFKFECYEMNVDEHIPLLPSLR